MKRIPLNAMTPADLDALYERAEHAEETNRRITNYTAPPGSGEPWNPCPPSAATTATASTPITCPGAERHAATPANRPCAAASRWRP
ncbi:hypothetical protein ACIO6T_37370 [Streptomyces sp. NPDC087532]|uniref:hypothetical protein n=1 Tax=Streptomyces sp. NPDC087532 TaxID=3365795 RepID=UPI0037F9BB64